MPIRRIHRNLGLLVILCLLAVGTVSYRLAVRPACGEGHEAVQRGDRPMSGYVCRPNGAAR